MSRLGKTLPVVVIVCLFLVAIAAWAGLYWWALSMMPGLAWLRVLIALGALGTAGVLLAVFVQRMREIRRGEEDDLSNY